MPSEGRPVRLKDVADHAGVSLATASRMLSDADYKGRAALRDRVLAAAAELGYRPNLHARALASSTSTSVGLVVHDVRDSYFAMIAGGVIEVAEAHDLLVTMVCTYRDPRQELNYLRLLSTQRPRAIVLAGSSFSDRAHAAAMMEQLAAYQAAGGAIVSVTRGRKIGHLVKIGNVEAARRLAHRLVDLGHTSFGVISGPAKLTSVSDRLRGFRLGLEDRGVRLAPGSIVRVDLSRDGGARGARLLLDRPDRPDRPTCVFGVADVVAVGAMAWIRSAGLRVPADVSVAGFGGTPLAFDTVPVLTTVELPLERIGRVAMELALLPGNEPRHTVEIDGAVQMRDSTAPPRP
ncbi:LacI family DNA-binding transcriptional regulator [Actinomadura rudentiformis]|uniref:LacI family transcriptional regulator n=1 Tax=Actinomadura rudentiformis TaxID=359158 RepID=A0A6H9YME2_9ACTN|nr:LacI family DNA-binding transcriptional regulator [Actinomadura rudentiformis]KAB2347892.1 LacI family transcriptional regulator [Actinomadura rudentiformis]